MRNAIVWCLALAVVLLGTLPSEATQNKKKRPPNILYIMADDHASAAISAYGSWLKDTAPTPNLDRLAKEGMLFTNCLVTNSICTPVRAVVLTGQYSHKNGVYTLSDSFDVRRITIAHLLSALGYQTALFGKWHLGTDPQGFDHWNMLTNPNGRPGQGRYHDPIMRAKGEEKTQVHKGYSTDVITDLSIAWLKQRDKNKPFFLMTHYKAPHRQWDPAERFWVKFKDKKIPEPKTLLDTYENRHVSSKNAKMKIGQDMTPSDLGMKEFPKGLKGLELRRWAYQWYMRRYLSCITAVDENVGRLLDYLDDEGIENETIVIYTSDQGFFLGEHGWYDKRFIYEPCLTTPLIVRYPGHVPAGKTNTDMVLNVDYAPTILDYAGAKMPKNMDGKSIRPLLEGKTPPDWRTAMYYRYYMHLAHHYVPAHYGIRDNRYTMVYFYSEPTITDNGKEIFMKGSLKKSTPTGWELFDRQKDPHQIRNVYHDPEYAEVVRRLTSEMRRLQSEVHDTQGPPIPEPKK